MDCDMYVSIILKSACLDVSAIKYVFVIMFTSFRDFCLYVTVSQYTSGKMICQHLFLIKIICEAMRVIRQLPVSSICQVQHTSYFRRFFSRIRTWL